MWRQGTKAMQEFGRNAPKKFIASRTSQRRRAASIARSVSKHRSRLKREEAFCRVISDRGSYVWKGRRRSAFVALVAGEGNSCAARHWLCKAIPDRAVDVSRRRRAARGHPVDPNA